MVCLRLKQVEMVFERSKMDNFKYMGQKIRINE